MLVGYSLGGYIAWLAAQQAASPLVDVVLISAAMGDRVDTWKGIDELGTVVNVYSRQDLALKRAYPLGVGKDDTPAAGLGPLVVDSDNLTNIDVTDLVGWDHNWASRNLSRLVTIALGCLVGRSSCVAPWSRVPGPGDRGVEAELPALVADRLYRWAFIDTYLWLLVRRARQGDLWAVRMCAELDAWSRKPGYFEDLQGVGLSAMTLDRHGICRTSVDRAWRQLGGLVRLWMDLSDTLSLSPPERASRESVKVGEQGAAGFLGLGQRGEVPWGEVGESVPLDLGSCSAVGDFRFDG